MFGALPLGFLSLSYLLSSPFTLAITVFWLWMLVDAVRRGEWLWVFFIVIGSVLSAVFYFFLVYRAAPSATQAVRMAERRGSAEAAAAAPSVSTPFTGLA